MEDMQLHDLEHVGWKKWNAKKHQCFLRLFMEYVWQHFWCLDLVRTAFVRQSRQRIRIWIAVTNLNQKEAEIPIVPPNLIDTEPANDSDCDHGTDHSVAQSSNTATVESIYHLRKTRYLGRYASNEGSLMHARCVMGSYNSTRSSVVVVDALAANIIVLSSLQYWVMFVVW